MASRCVHIPWMRACSLSSTSRLRSSLSEMVDCCPSSSSSSSSSLPAAPSTGASWTIELFLKIDLSSLLAASLMELRTVPPFLFLAVWRAWFDCGSRPPPPPPPPPPVLLPAVAPSAVEEAVLATPSTWSVAPDTVSCALSTVSVAVLVTLPRPPASTIFAAPCARSYLGRDL